MKNLLSKFRKWWSTGGKLRNLGLWEKLADLKDWVMSHLSCHTFLKSMVLILSAVLLHFGCLSPMWILKLGLLSWGGILLHKHHAEHWHI
jgi:hypothetical protein